MADVKVNVARVYPPSKATDGFLGLDGEFRRYVDGVDDGAATGPPVIPLFLGWVSFILFPVWLSPLFDSLARSACRIPLLVWSEGPVLQVSHLRRVRQRRWIRIGGLDCARQMKCQRAMARAGFENLQGSRLSALRGEGDMDVEEGDN